MTNPRSVQLGFGPVCLKRAIEESKARGGSTDPRIIDYVKIKK